LQGFLLPQARERLFGVDERLSRQFHLAFGVCSDFSEMHRDLFGWWVQLRHHDCQQVRGDAADVTTVGVLLSPRTDGVRAIDTTMYAVRGEMRFSDDELRALREAWPNPD
jgi:hypothetical protein